MFCVAFLAVVDVNEGQLGGAVVSTVAPQDDTGFDSRVEFACSLSRGYPPGTPASSHAR